MMTRRKRVHQTIHYLRFRYRLWKYDYFLWSTKPKLFGVAFVIGLIAILLSEKAIIDYKFEVLDPKADALESVAMAVEQTPDQWLKIVEEKKGKVSEYEYQLEYQKYRYFAPRAPSLAEKIRDKKFREVLKDTGRLGAEQVAQYAAGKTVGKGVKYIGTYVGPKVGAAGVKLFNQGYKTAGRIAMSGSSNIVKSGSKIGEVSTSLIWEIGSAMGTKTKMPPARELAQKSPEFAALFELIKQATEENPDKLMTAALHHVIQNVSHAKDDEPEDYRNSVMMAARSLSNMTQAGGSPTSIWKDVDELAKWLANKIGKPLPDEPEPEYIPPPPTSTLDNFTAHGEFTRYKDMEEWTKNEITIKVENWVVSGTGVLVNEVKTSALHRYSKNNFAFSGKFYQAQEGTSALGYFKNTLVIHNSEQYSSVTGDNGTHEKRFSWNGTLREGGIIEGTLNDWPVDFKLVIE